MSWLQTLLHGKPPVPACALLLLQRNPVTLDLDSVLDVVEPAFGRSLSSGHPYWYASCRDPKIASLSFGKPSISLFVAEHPEFDEDRATSKLPPLAERASWGPYVCRLEVDCFSDTLDPGLRLGMAAKVALAYLNENCTGIYDSFHRQFLTVTPDTIGWLQQCVATMPPAPPEDQVGPTVGTVLLLHQPLPLDANAFRAGAERGFGGAFPHSDFWDLTAGRRPSVMADAKSVYLRQGFRDDTVLDALLPPPSARQGWPAYAALLAFTSTGTNNADTAIRQGAAASMALGFLNEHCVGAYDLASRTFSSDPAAVLSFLRSQAAAGPHRSNPMKAT